MPVSGAKSLRAGAQQTAASSGVNVRIKREKSGFVHEVEGSGVK